MLMSCMRVRFFSSRLVVGCLCYSLCAVIYSQLIMFSLPGKREVSIFCSLFRAVLHFIGESDADVRHKYVTPHTVRSKNFLLQKVFNTLNTQFEDLSNI